MKPSFLLLLFLTVCLTYCTSPKVLNTQEIAVGGEKSVLYYEVSNLLIKNAKGRKVFSGKALVYKDKIAYYDRVREKTISIPNKEIDLIYGRFQGGGISLSLFSVVALAVVGGVDERNYEPCDGESCGFNFGPLGIEGGMALGFLLSPITGFIGSSLFNRDILLYERPINSPAPRNYFSMIENIPKDRWIRIEN